MQKNPLFTTLLSNRKVKKDHPSIELSGLIDETRTSIAILYSDLNTPINEFTHDKVFILRILKIFFRLGEFASKEKCFKQNFSIISIDELTDLQNAINKLKSSITMPKDFILAFSTPLAAKADFARVQVRKLERTLIKYYSNDKVSDEELFFKFINELSNYFFYLSLNIDKNPILNESKI